MYWRLYHEDKVLIKLLLNLNWKLLMLIKLVQSRDTSNLYYCRKLYLACHTLINNCNKNKNRKSLITLTYLCVTKRTKITFELTMEKKLYISCNEFACHAISLHAVIRLWIQLHLEYNNSLFSTFDRHTCMCIVLLCVVIWNDHSSIRNKFFLLLLNIWRHYKYVKVLSLLPYPEIQVPGRGDRETGRNR